AEVWRAASTTVVTPATRSSYDAAPARTIFAGRAAGLLFVRFIPSLLLRQHALDPPEDLHDRSLLLEDARDDLLRRQVRHVRLGTRVLAVEIAPAREQLGCTHLPRPFPLLAL